MQKGKFLELENRMHNSLRTSSTSAGALVPTYIETDENHTVMLYYEETKIEKINIESSETFDFGNEHMSRA